MGTKLECWRCEHAWDYSGSLVKATCPSCGAKVRVDENKIEDTKND